jgi:hypothetical protein
VVLSIGKKCSDILTRPDMNCVVCTAYTLEYLVDFILDDVAQLRPFYAVIGRQSVRPENNLEMQAALYKIGRGDTFECIVVV